MCPKKAHAQVSLGVVKQTWTPVLLITTITRNVLLSAQIGERASVVLICIITSLYNDVK